MTPEEFKDLGRLWTLCHASLDFEAVEDICNNLLVVNADREEPIYFALLTALYIIYGRPFKENDRKLKLSKDFVPDQFRELHEKIMRQRDKAFAHIDTSGPEGVHFHRVTITYHQMGSRSRLISTEKIMSLPAFIQKVKDLSEILGRKSADERDGLLTKYEAYFPVGAAFFLNVTDRNGPFVLPSPR